MEVFTDKNKRSSNHKHGSNFETCLQTLQWLFFLTSMKQALRCSLFMNI